MTERKEPTIDTRQGQRVSFSTGKPCLRVRLLRQPTKSAFLINVLMMTVVMRDIAVVAIRIPNFSQTGRSLRDTTKEETYQSNSNNEAATISTRYTMPHNYYHNAFGHGVTDETSSYGGIAGNTPNFGNLQLYGNGAAGQSFVAEEHDAERENLRPNTATLPQIDGIRATGRYRGPSGKTDYEINAANYDVGSETTDSTNTNEQNTDVIDTNDAYDIQTMQNLARLQQKQQQQQQQKQHHHQLVFATGNLPLAQDNTNGMAAFRNFEQPSDTTLGYIDTKQQQTHGNDKYLRNLDMKPKGSDDMYHQEILMKGQQHSKPYTFASFEQPVGHNIFRVSPHTQENQQYQRNHQDQQGHHEQIQSNNHHQHKSVYPDLSLNSQWQQYHPHGPSRHMSHQRSLDLLDDHQTVNTLETSLPKIKHTVHHTPASSAALAGVPLGRHVEVVKHVPVTHYKREQVPFNQTVPFEIPNPIISTVSKPMPIQVPFPQTVAISDLQVLHIPIDKVKPVPVEKAVPYLVEKHVPFRVEKQIARPVFYQYPIHVPVVTTVVHHQPHQSSGHHYHHYASHPRKLHYSHKTSYH